MKLWKTLQLSLLCVLLATVAHGENESLVVTPEGNVGIGTEVPDKKLTVDGDAKVTGNMDVEMNVDIIGDLTVEGKITAMSAVPVIPVGSIIAWHKSGADGLTLPEGWVECNGQAISDTDSPFAGTTVPDLNNQVYANDRGRYLRGGNTSGQFNESTYYTDNGHKYYAKYGSYYGGMNYGNYAELDHSNGTILSYGSSRLGTSRRFQVAAMTVVWIMKIK